MALVVGFMQSLDRELSRQSSKFESSVLRTMQGREQIEGLHCWGRGFLTALALGSQGLKWRSASAGAAVRVIASSTSASAPVRSQQVEDVVGAALALMKQRASRGPLGALEAATAPLDSSVHLPDAKKAAQSRV